MQPAATMRKGAKRPSSSPGLAPMTSPSLEIRSMSKRYGGPDGAGVDNIDLDVEHGEIVAVLGPSGSGKSTILKCVAGLERPDSGSVRVGGRVLSDGEQRVWVPPEKRGVSVVFQSLALWPHMSVFENVAYPLVAAKVPKAEVGTRVAEILDLVGCGQYMSRRPGEISGGEQQRVACARALVGRPSLVLFDEPFSSLDAALRAELRRWLLRLRDDTMMTALFVTHDQAEAFTVGDRVAVVLDGNLVEKGTPRELYERPRHGRVARVLGSINLLPAEVADVTPSGVRVRGDDVTLLSSVPDAQVGVEVGDQVTIGMRPARIEVVSDEDSVGPENVIEAVLTFARFTGVTTHYEARCGGTTFEIISTNHGHEVGERVRLSVDPTFVLVLTDGQQVAAAEVEQ